MKTHTQNENNKPVGMFWLAALVIAIPAIAIVMFIITSKNENRYTVIQMNAKNGGYNLSKGFITYQFKYDSLYKQALLAERNDILLFGDHAYYLQDPTIDSIAVNIENDTAVYINGELNTIILDSSFDITAVLEKLTEQEIRTLQSICVNTKIPASCFPYLEKIARINKNVSIQFFEEEDSTGAFVQDLKKMTSLFNPRFFLVALEEDQLSVLAGLKNLECLYLTINTKQKELSDELNNNGLIAQKVIEIKKQLPPLSSLKQCILVGDLPYMLPANFFSNDPQLERLTVSAEQDLSFIDPLKNLSELNLLFNKLDVAELSNRGKNLEVLGLYGDTCKNINSLPNIPRLTWLALPKNISQQDFNTIITAGKQLEVLQLQHNASLKDLSTLKQLTTLRGLIIADSVADTGTLHSLSQLRFLSIPEENFENAGSINSLQKSLPGCIIVPNSGACLGSGWLLLLLPFVLLCYVVQKIMNRKQKLKSFS